MKFLRFSPDTHYGYPEVEESDIVVMPYTWEQLYECYEAANYNSINMGAEGNPEEIFDEYGNYPPFHWVYLVPDDFDVDIKRIENEFANMAIDYPWPREIEGWDQHFPAGTIRFGGREGFSSHVIGGRGTTGTVSHHDSTDLAKIFSDYFKKSLDSSESIEYDTMIETIGQSLPNLKTELDSIGFDWERAKKLSKRTRMLKRERGYRE